MSMHKRYHECLGYVVYQGYSASLDYEKIKHLIGMNMKFPNKICLTRMWTYVSLLEHGFNL